MIDFSSLPAGSILLAPSHLHPMIRKELLKHTDGKLGLQLHTLNGYLSSFSLQELPSQAAILFAYYSQVKPLKKQWEIYQNVVLTPSFLKECYQFIEDLKFYDIPVASLKEDTAANKEIKAIITLLYSIPTPMDRQRKAMTLLSTQSLDHVYIYDSFFTLKEQRLITSLLDQGAHLLQDQRTPVTQHFYHAVNKRQEIEACAQYILSHDFLAEDISVVLADNTYAPVVKQMFDRYHIPYTDVTSNGQASCLSNRLLALLAYYQHPDHSHFLDCLSSGVFTHEHLSSLQSYLQIYEKHIDEPFQHLQHLTCTSHILDAYDLQKMTQLEQLCEQARQDIAAKLEGIVHAQSYEDLLLYAMQLLRESMDTSPTQTAVLSKLQDLLQEVYPYIQEDRDLSFLCILIKDIAAQPGITQLQGTGIYSLTQLPLSCQHLFLLGVTQGNYPAFPSKAGIFDEAYYESLPYPDMEKRYSFHIQQLEKLFHRSEEVYISYPLGTYEGKSLEAALEIEQMFAHAVPYPFAAQYEECKTEAILQPQTAKELYVHQQQILGSISAMERYVKCPFSYFLRYGLGLREPMKLGFADSYMGTFHHYLLEALTKEAGKAYTKTADSRIHDLIKQEIQATQEVFPNMQERLSILRQRIEDSFLQTLRRLDDLETHSHFQPWQQEKEFYYTLPIQDDITLSLHGFIDRLDVCDDLACILDYKSSAKHLSEANVFAALQLQLLTYSFVVAKQEEKTVQGAYYVSLKNENIPHPAGKLSRRKPVTYTPIEREELQAAAKKAHRLQGWTMQPSIDLLDDDGTHISGVRQNKDGEVKAAKLYDLSTIEQSFNTMYQDITARMLEGDIRIEPSEDACLYCVYHEICRFHGLPFERKPIVETDDTLYWKGEDNDA